MRCILFYSMVTLIISCGQASNTSPGTTSMDTAATTAAASSDKPREEKIFDYPVLLKHWQMGDHENTRVVLKMYKAWDNKSIDDMKGLLADSMIMDLPNGKRLAANRDEMVAGLLKRRQNYASASNEILAAYPLFNTENNDNWVNVLVYNKWIYQDKARDSMLFQDLWKIKDGKITYLLSLQQTPSRVELKGLEKMISKK